MFVAFTMVWQFADTGLKVALFDSLTVRIGQNFPLCCKKRSLLGHSVLDMFAAMCNIPQRTESWFDTASWLLEANLTSDTDGLCLIHSGLSGRKSELESQPKTDS